MEKFINDLIDARSCRGEKLIEKKSNTTMSTQHGPRSTAQGPKTF